MGFFGLVGGTIPSVVAAKSDDFYDILGVSRSADEKEIKSAYKQAARKYHPDNNETGNEELFKKVGEAYDTLKDPQKKSIYDQYGKEGLKGFGGAQGFGGFSGDFNGAGFEDLSDVFASFFGGGFGGGARGGRSGPRASRGQDHTVDITLNFLDAVTEQKKKIRLNPLVECSACHGRGAEKETDLVTCPTCQGQGQVVSVQNTILGQIRQSSTCPTCHGSGKKITNPCKPCHGKGYKREEKEVEIAIPPGIYDGATMRLAGLGDTGRNGGPPGDIYLAIHVKAHDKFERDGADVYSEIHIGFPEAALGTSFEVPTVQGNKKLEIKAGTQSEETYTIKSAGMPKLNNPARFGDHFVKVKVITPYKSLSSKEKDLLKEFQKLRQGRDNKI